VPGLVKIASTTTDKIHTGAFMPVVPSVQVKTSGRFSTQAEIH
jgi:hypothetical protein